MAYSPTGFYRTVDANILTPPVEVTSTPWASETGVHGAHYPNIRKTGDIFIVLSASTTGMHTGCRTPEGIRQDVAPLDLYKSSLPPASPPSPML